MRQSRLFTKTRREAPADEVAKNAQLLIRAGFIHKEMAGVYDYLPLGLRVFERIVKIIREEMNAIGGQEMHMSALQNPEVWEKSGRWNDDVVDIWFKTKIKNGGEVGLGNTHEEPVTALMREHISSYKDLPKYPYQFQVKFRNEARAKSGILRTREFMMKDLYSFSKDQTQHHEFYEKAAEAYQKIFNRVGIGDSTVRVLASGGSFSKYSHEFQTICDTGEDTIYTTPDKKTGLNKEVIDDAEALAEIKTDRNDLKEVKAIEVGNIFSLGTKYSDALGLTYKDDEGKDIPVYMGSYGIGPGRIMGTIAELMSDEKGLVWPEAVAPYLVHLLCLTPDDATVKAYADTLYEDLQKAGVDVLYDDRSSRAGEKLADADLIGIPARVIIGKNTIESGKIESTYRRTGQTNLVDREQLIAFATGAQKQHHG